MGVILCKPNHVIICISTLLIPLCENQFHKQLYYIIQLTFCQLQSIQLVFYGTFESN